MSHDTSTDERHGSDPASGAGADAGAVGPDDADLPEWDDEYLQRAAERLAFNYDLERDRTAGGEQFDLYGRLEMESKKHFLHPALNFANHHSFEYLFARRTHGVGVDDLEALVEVGHDLADDWIEADEEHFNTDFTFVVVAPAVSDDVRSFVDGFRDRTLLKYGFYGHYEVNLVVVAPGEEDSVASQEATVEEAFRTWEDIERQAPGLLDLVRRRLQL
ncbi:MAG: hypothetical protein ABEJ05_01550 [Haloglomus sp.]